jgi:ketosteroid isomerase-like protein
MYSESVEVVIRFVTAINTHNINLISDMMTNDHTFTDSIGHVYKGKDVMIKGWTNYLDMFPDYKIEADEIYCDSNKVLFTGKASGTYIIDGKLSEKNHWEIIAVWRAVVEEDKIKQWQVFGDNKPVYEIIERNK